MELQWILIGEIVSTQGIRGEVRVVIHTEFPERYTTMPTVHLFASESTGPEKTLAVENCRFHRNFAVLKLAGIDTMNDALELKGMAIKVQQEELVSLPPNRHYIFQLIGLNVVTIHGLHVGQVTDVLQQSGVNDIYVVKPVAGITKLREVLIPVIDDVVLDIDTENHQITVNLLDGLLE